MEVGLIKQFERYSIEHNIPEVYRILTDPDLPSLTHADLNMPGAVKLDVVGERGIYIVLQHATTGAAENGFFEAHRDFIDVHVPLEGAESIGYTPLDGRVSPGGPLPVYDRSKSDDITYSCFASANEMTVIRLVEGMYALFEPDDVHMPKLQTDGPSPLKKMVVKIPVRPVRQPDDKLLAVVAQQGSALGALLSL